MFYLVDHNLDKRIAVGFHSHNNLQLCFANVQELLQLNTPRQLIVDASLYGMGRGAGNLNTELVTQYINTNFGLQYDNIEILELIDEYIRPLSIQYKWGYEAAYYIASITGCHPNYASFLMNKQTLHIQDIYAILNSLDINRRALFDKDYIGEEYISYMSNYVDDSEILNEITDNIGKKKILLLAPGKSLNSKTEIINSIINSGEYYVISVNFLPKDIKVDMLFVSNMKRFADFSELIEHSADNLKVIVTSNITKNSEKNLSAINYSSYINEEQCIADNAGLMCINFLKKIGVGSILMAGFDGFSAKAEENFYDSSMNMNVEQERLLKINVATAEKIKQLSAQIKLEFLTDSVYMV
jgi:4-hydroxy 2-oxovalerate aldolase